MTGALSRGWTIFAALALAPTLLFSFRDLWVIQLFLWFPIVWPAMRQPGRWLQPAPWALPVFGLFAWIIVTLLWTPSSRGAEDVLAYGIFLFVSMQMLRFRFIDAPLYAIAIYAALILVTVDIAFGNGIRALVPPDNLPAKDAIASARGLGLALLMLPAAVLIVSRQAKRKAAVRSTALIAALGAFAGGILANAVALLAGLLAFAGTTFRKLPGLKILVALWASIIAAPFAMAAALPSVERLLTWTHLPDSTLHRLIIWRQVLDLWISENPLFGAGARASKTLSGRLGQVTMASGTEISLVSAHPHNVPIQILYEFGLVGYGLALAALILGARNLLANPWKRDMAAAIAALGAMLLVFVSIETDFWNVYTWCAVILCVCGLQAASREALR